MGRFGDQGDLVSPEQDEIILDDIEQLQNLET